MNEQQKKEVDTSVLRVEGAAKMMQIVDPILTRGHCVTTVWFDRDGNVLRRDQTVLVEPLPKFSLFSTA